MGRPVLSQGHVTSEEEKKTLSLKSCNRCNWVLFTKKQYPDYFGVPSLHYSISEVGGVDGPKLGIQSPPERLVPVWYCLTWDGTQHGQDWIPRVLPRDEQLSTTNCQSTPRTMLLLQTWGLSCTPVRACSRWNFATAAGISL